MIKNDTFEKIYENRRNERLKSICRHIENKSTEIALRSVAYTGSKTRLSYRVFNFLYGNEAPYFLNEERRSAQSSEIIKYIMQNNLLQTFEEKLKTINPRVSRREKLVMALNIQFGDDGYQNAPNSNAPLERVYSHEEEDKKEQKAGAKVHTPEEMVEKLLRKECERGRE